ncbi:response regulator transcription factor [Streptomyces sp. NPDC058369]|uniref:response regulator transcription factor n=1 Tax=unclassified Streptomyces TaxID=2593676 RepID=UPI0022514877|nr:hypothetical protein [Streptomyces sp. NBC_01789]MCX4444871.1 hypothetical protein [Streptomyces sp. NBC_01789]
MNPAPDGALFLTAHHTITGRLTGFSAGRDDYLANAFHLAELVGRLRAASRRTRPKDPAVNGDLVLDPVRFTCTAAGQPVDLLTPTEIGLLAALIASTEGLSHPRELVRTG